MMSPQAPSEPTGRTNQGVIEFTAYEFDNHRMNELLQIVKSGKGSRSLFLGQTQNLNGFVAEIKEGKGWNTAHNRQNPSSLISVDLTDFSLLQWDDGSFWRRIADSFWPMIAHALAENETIEEANLRNVTLASWDLVFQAVQNHRTIRRLNVQPAFSRLPPAILRAHATSAVADVLKKNRVIEEVEFYDGLYDPHIWERSIAPKLECNRYRRRVYTMRKSRQRDALFSHALSHTTQRGMPNATWILLSMNQDLFC